MVIIIFLIYICFPKIFPCFYIVYRLVALSGHMTFSCCVPLPLLLPLSPTDEALGLFPSYCCYNAAMNIFMQIGFLSHLAILVCFLGIYSVSQSIITGAKVL